MLIADLGSFLERIHYFELPEAEDIAEGYSEYSYRRMLLSRSINITASRVDDELARMALNEFARILFLSECVPALSGQGVNWLASGIPERQRVQALLTSLYWYFDGLGTIPSDMASELGKMVIEYGNQDAGWPSVYFDRPANNAQGDDPWTWDQRVEVAVQVALLRKHGHSKAGASEWVAAKYPALQHLNTDPKRPTLTSAITSWCDTLRGGKGRALHQYRYNERMAMVLATPFRAMEEVEAFASIALDRVAQTVAFVKKDTQMPIPRGGVEPG